MNRSKDRRQVPGIGRHGEPQPLVLTIEVNLQDLDAWNLASVHVETRRRQRNREIWHYVFAVMTWTEILTPPSCAD